MEQYEQGYVEWDHRCPYNLEFTAWYLRSGCWFIIYKVVLITCTIKWYSSSDPRSLSSTQPIEENKTELAMAQRAKLKWGYKTVTYIWKTTHNLQHITKEWLFIEDARKFADLGSLLALQNREISV